MSDAPQRKGGLARAASLSPERRSEIARKAGSVKRKGKSDCFYVNIPKFLFETMHLTAEQSGAYFLLLMYQTMVGPLPDDPVRLATITKCSVQTWSSDLAPVILPLFAEGSLNGQK